jgi:hypothetical protein
VRTAEDGDDVGKGASGVRRPDRRDGCGRLEWAGRQRLDRTLRLAGRLDGPLICLYLILCKFFCHSKNFFYKKTLKNFFYI